MILLIDGDTLLYSIGSIQNIEDDNTFKKIFDNKIEKIKRTLNCSNYLIIIQGARNFRNKHDINYKKHRNSQKPKGYSTLRQHVIQKHKHIISNNIETDDMCNISAKICESLNKDYIVVHIDKDLDQIVGNHYNPTKNLIYSINEYDSLYNLAYQLIKGDVTDSKITGLKGYGHVKATNLLSNIELNELIPIVFKEYIKVYGYDIGIHKFYQTYNIIKIVDIYPKITKKLTSLINN